MVRHEAAEALGGIASDGAEEKGEDVLAILREWAVKDDAPVVVRESCQVAIDMWEVSPFLFILSSILALGVQSSPRTLSPVCEGFYPSKRRIGPRFVEMTSRIWNDTDG